MVFTSAFGIACAARIAGSAISRMSRLASLAALSLMLPAASPTASLELNIQHLRSDRGVLRVCLTASADNFPDCKDERRAITRSVPATEPHIRFDGLPPGNYAAAIVHDENGNGKLDTTMGIPREGFGFSRNPKIGFGPPSFAATRFALNDAGKPQSVRMRYLF